MAKNPARGLPKEKQAPTADQNSDSSKNQKEREQARLRQQRRRADPKKSFGKQHLSFYLDLKANLKKLYSPKLGNVFHKVFFRMLNQGGHGSNQIIDDVGILLNSFTGAEMLRVRIKPSDTKFFFLVAGPRNGPGVYILVLETMWEKLLVNIALCPIPFSPKVLSRESDDYFQKTSHKDRHSFFEYLFGFANFLVKQATGLSLKSVTSEELRNLDPQAVAETLFFWPRDAVEDKIDVLTSVPPGSKPLPPGWEQEYRDLIRQQGEFFSQHGYIKKTK